MKKTGLFVFVFAPLLATAAWAQGGPDGNSADTPQGTSPTSVSFPTMRVQTPTYADLYCAGFISKQTLPDANYVAGGLQTPTTTKFTRGDLVYLSGTGYSAGAEYEIVRALRDIDEYHFDTRGSGRVTMKMQSGRIIDNKMTYAPKEEVMNRFSKTARESVGA